MTWLRQGFIINKTGEWATRCLCNWDVHDLALPVVLRATMRHLHNAHDTTIDFDGGRLGIPLRGNVRGFTFSPHNGGVITAPSCEVCGDPITDTRSTRGPTTPKRCKLHRYNHCPVCGLACYGKIHLRCVKRKEAPNES